MGLHYGRAPSLARRPAASTGRGAQTRPRLQAGERRLPLPTAAPVASPFCRGFFAAAPGSGPAGPFPALLAPRPAGDGRGARAGQGQAPPRAEGSRAGGATWRCCGGPTVRLGGRAFCQGRGRQEEGGPGWDGSERPPRPPLVAQLRRGPSKRAAGRGRPLCGGGGLSADGRRPSRRWRRLRPR